MTRSCAFTVACFVFLTSFNIARSEERAIRLSNCENGTTIRYPVPLLRGTIADAEATTLVVINQSSQRDTRELKGLVHKGKFKALTELVPGKNDLILRAGRHELPLTLNYEPQTNPYFVRMIYMTDNTGDTKYQSSVENDPQDYAAKFDTALKIMQTFTAERMHNLGYGRCTFNLEFDENGKVKVHTFKGDHPAEYYYAMNDGAWFGHIGGRLDRRFPMETARNVVIAAYTRFDPKTRRVRGHTALGGGGMALFGSGGVFTWPSSLGDVFRAFMDERPVDPTRVFDDSAGRSTFWAMASTTIGATLHELCHTFGLPHGRDPFDIMTRGFDHFNRAFAFVDPPSRGRKTPDEFSEKEIAYFAPVSGANLKPTRWLALDKKERVYPPQIFQDEKSGDIVIEASYGIRFVGLDVRGDVADYISFVDAADPPKRLTLSRAEIRKRVGTDDVRMRVMDNEGLIEQAETSRLLRTAEFVRSWHFASTTKSWTNANAFVSVSDAELKAIEASATTAPLISTKDPFVDFLPRFQERQTYVAAYAVRTILSDKARKVKILTGSDDTLRVWLNGKVVVQVLALRPAQPDQDSTTVELVAGKNVLVAEVSQAGGGWGLYLRFEDENGGSLQLTDDGKLVALKRE